MTTASTPALTHSAWTHPAARPFTVLGTIGIVGGGLLSAAVASMPSYHTSWAVAYIVLVPGVAQIVLGVAQAAVINGRVRAGTLAAQALLWNLGAAATVAATLMNVSVLLFFAAAAQIIAVVLFLLATRHGRRGTTLTILRIVSILMLVSTPTGVVLQAILH